MAPEIQTGDWVVTVDSSSAPRPGEIAVCRGSDGRPRAHRVVQSDLAGIVTRGDAEPRPDPFCPLSSLQGIVIAVVRRPRPGIYRRLLARLARTFPAR
jgi:hypothetical protein